LKKFIKDKISALARILRASILFASGILQL